MRTYDAETMRWRAFRAESVAALAAGFVLRVWFVWHHPRFSGDTLVYGDLAHNLLAHHVYGLTEERVRSTLIRLPGYPLFLAMCFAVFGTVHRLGPATYIETASYMPVLWIQVAVDLLSCILIGDLARRLFGRRVGLAALWLSALCPFTANYAAAALTETLSVFSVVLGLWGLERWIEALRAGRTALGWAALLGGALTCAALLRPDGGLLAAVIVPAMLWEAFRASRQMRRRMSKRAAAGGVLASGLLCAALGVWAGRNWLVFHVVQPLAPKYANDPDEPAPLGFARWYRTWAIGFGDTVNVYWTYDGSPLRMSDLPPRAFDSAAQRQQTARLYARYNELQSASPAIDAEFAALAAERVRAHPVRYYLLLPMAKLADMWLRPRTELMKLPLAWWDARAHPRRSLFQIGYAALNLALLVLAGVGWMRWHRLKWTGSGSLAFAGTAYVLLRSAMLMTIDNSEPRYTLECFPVVLLLAALALSGAWRDEVQEA